MTQAAKPGVANFGVDVGAMMSRCDSGVATCAHDAGPAQHHANSERGEPVQDGGKAVCLQFCDDESSALAKGRASQAYLPGPVLLAGVQWSPAVAVSAAASWQPVERPASVGPPLFVRLMRLTT
jgi:hypothetical protein